MVNIPPIYGDFGDGWWHCFNHIISRPSTNPHVLTDMASGYPMAISSDGDWKETHGDFRTTSHFIKKKHRDFVLDSTIMV